jgi:hypothetical protein
VKHDEGRTYQWISKGQAWFNFNKLPAGSFQLRFNGQGATSTGLKTGNMPLTVQSFGENQEITIA